jgi:hypothetical protein
MFLIRLYRYPHGSLKISFTSKANDGDSGDSVTIVGTVYYFGFQLLAPIPCGNPTEM